MSGSITKDGCKHGTYIHAATWQENVVFKHLASFKKFMLGTRTVKKNTNSVSLELISHFKSSKDSQICLN